MPDLGGVAAAPSIVRQIYGVENGQFFVEVFPVDVAIRQNKPAFLLFVPTDPEKDAHAGSLFAGLPPP
jgi:hypothetical protein